jgi:hypothetical protein
MKSLGPSPPLDLGMVSLPENLWNTPTTKLGRSSELGLLQETVRPEALGHRTVRISHCARQETCHSLDDQTGTHLSSRQDDISDADFGIDQVFTNSVVDAFVPSTQKAETARHRTMGECKFSGECLIEASTARAEQQQRSGRVDRLDTREYGLGTHDHSRSPAEWRIIHAPVHVHREIAQIVTAQIEEPGLAALSKETLRAEIVHHAREDREDVHSQGEPAEFDSYNSNKPSGGSTTTEKVPPPSLVTLVTKFTGISAPESSSSRSLAGFAITDTHFPRTTP